MGNLTAEQATDLGDMFQGMVQALQDFRDNNDIPDDVAPGLNQYINQLSQDSQHLYTLSAGLVLDDVQGSLDQIKTITGQINANIRSLQNVQKGINIAAAAVKLTSSIISLDPNGIANAVGGLVNTWKS